MPKVVKAVRSASDPDSGSIPNKKPFDKKRWRENKYSNKVKVKRWKEQRERSVKQKYFKFLKKESKNANLTPLGPRKNRDKEEGGEPSKDKGNTGPSFVRAKMEFERRQKVAEKRQKEEERKQKYLERQESFKASVRKRKDRNKMLSKRTRKGQPIMSGRAELLLEKIQRQQKS